MISSKLEIPVLCVDDESSICYLAKEFLEMSGRLKVDAASSVAEARTMMASHCYRAIVSDYQMPFEDGIQFLKSLRSSSDMTPFILFTGKGREEIVIEAINNGADAYLQKGGESASLFAELEQRLLAIIRTNEAEEALSERESEFQALFESNPDPVVLISLDGIVINTNRAGADMVMLSKEEIIGAPIHAMGVFSEEDQAIFRHAMASVLNGERITPIVAQVNRKDGSTRWVEMRSSVVKKDGHPCAFQLIARDITDRMHDEQVLKQKYDELNTAIMRSTFSESESLKSLASVFKIEDELRKEMDFSESLIESLPGIFYVYDAETFRLVRWNRNHMEVSGYSEEEMAGKHLLDWHRPDHAAEVLAAFDACMKHGQISIEAPLVMKDRGEVTYLLTGTRFDAKGRSYLMGVGVDITERLETAERIKRLNQELKESEERYRSLYTDSPDAIMILSKDRGYLAGNPATCRLFGCIDDNDFLSRSPQSLSPEYQPDGSLSTEKAEMLMSLALKKGVQFFEWTHRKADGTVFPATVLLSRFENSKEPLLQATIRDISQLKQAEEEKQQNEETMRLVVASAPFPLMITNWDGSYILDSNSQAQEAFGLEPGMGQQLADLFADENDLKTLLKELTDHGSLDGMEVALISRIGERRSHLLSARTISYPGEVRLLLTTYDITEHIRMEKALHDANMKLSILNRITRHDMLNQMTVLNGYIQLSRGKEKDPQLATYLEKMARASNNLEEQLSFTKDYQEMGVKAPVWVSLSKKLTDAFTMLHPEGVVIEDTSDDVEILADQLAEKVPYNLVDNSMRHGGGVSHIKMSAEQIGDSMHVIYHDDGQGINENDREHLFEKGFGKNTGLGLFLTREILAITGISIEENGQPGEGVSFKIIVPAGGWRKSSR